jgi:hypothetical protein
MALKTLRLGRGDFLLHYINFRLCQALFLQNKFFYSKRKVASKKKYFNFHDKSLENSFSSACDWMKANNFSDYMALSKSQARALGLPATRFVASQHGLREQKFKDGKGFFNGTERKVSTGRKPVPRR